MIPKWLPAATFLTKVQHEASVGHTHFTCCLEGCHYFVSFCYFEITKALGIGVGSHMLILPIPFSFEFKTLMIVFSESIAK